jgi:plastocyanin
VSSPLARLLFVVTFSLPTLAWSTTIQGSIGIPEGFEAEVDTSPSTWLFENGIVAIRPPLDDPRTHMIIVLEGGEGATMPPTTVVVALRDMRLDPRVIPIVSSSSVDFRNEDRVVHALRTVGDDRVPPQPQAPGSLRTIKFSAPGIYQLRCTEVPHVHGTVMVLAAGRFAVPKATGAYRIDDVPPGSYTLKVWYAGEYLHSQTVDVRGDSINVDVKVAARKTARSSSPKE